MQPEIIWAKKDYTWIVVKKYNLFQDYIKDNHQRPSIRSFSRPK